MTEKPYGLVHAKSLLAPCGASEQWDIDERGVFPKPQPEPREDKTQTLVNNLADFHPLLAWRPAVVFKDDTPAPDLINTPSLPLPFDARDLAAFMLYGVGCLAANFYGAWEDGPDKSAIDQINPLDTFARQAVIEAFAAYREAQKIVGPYPLELDEKAEHARKAWSVANHEANQREGVFDSKLEPADSKARRERAKTSIAALDLEMEATAKADKAAKEKWLEAMVRQLLQSTLAKANLTPVPTVVASDGPSNRRNRKPSWAVVAMPYLKELYAKGNYRSSSVFYKALKNKVDDDNSPFELVKGELFCPEAGTTVGESTLGNVWHKVRE
jgi:hypothetical protein